jgi:N utilization substance protein B
VVEVDEVIKVYAKNWDFKRIARVDLAILRLAIHEMLHRRDIPPVVSINEAIDLSKEFSNPDAKRFINGILDQFKLTLNRPLRDADL